MADQAGAGAVAGHPPEGGSAATVSASGHPQSFHGRTVSWVAALTIVAGFIVGGVGLMTGPTWWLFWTGVGLAAAGGLLALATNIFEDWY